MMKNDKVTELRGLIDELHKKVSQAEVRAASGKPLKDEELAKAIRALSDLRPHPTSW